MKMPPRFAGTRLNFAASSPRIVKRIKVTGDRRIGGNVCIPKCLGVDVHSKTMRTPDRFQKIAERGFA